MTDGRAHHSREMQLELLLRELLGEATGSQIDAARGAQVPQEVAELRDLARRLQLSAQWIPLPEGREVLRRALLAMAVARSGQASGNSTHRRSRWGFMVAAAAALIVGVYGLGSGLAEIAGSPSSPWYDARVALEELKVAFVSSPMGKAEMLVKATHARITEIEAMAASGDARGLRRAADALDGEAGWLHATMTRMSPEDRKRVVSELAAVTGVSGKVTGSPLLGGPAVGSLGASRTPSADHRAWVSLVARTAAQLEAEGNLPAGVTLGDLVSRAAHGGSGAPLGSTQGNHPTNGGPSNHKANERGKGKGKGNGGNSGGTTSGKGGGTVGGQAGASGSQSGGTSSRQSGAHGPQGGTAAGKGAGTGDEQGGGAGGQSGGQGGGISGGQGGGAGGQSGGKGGSTGGGQGGGAGGQGGGTGDHGRAGNSAGQGGNSGGGRGSGNGRGR